MQKKNEIIRTVFWLGLHVKLISARDTNAYAASLQQGLAARGRRSATSRSHALLLGRWEYGTFQIFKWSHFAIWLPVVCAPESSGWPHGYN